MVVASLRVGPDGRTKSWEWAAGWMNSEISRRGLEPFRRYTSNMIKAYLHYNEATLILRWGENKLASQTYIDNLDAIWAQKSAEMAQQAQNQPPESQPDRFVTQVVSVWPPASAREQAPNNNEPVEKALTPEH